MTDILYEVRSHQRRHGRIKLVSREQAESMPGFISVCGYPPVTAELINKQRGTFNLGDMPLYVDKVVLDFDDADKDYVRSVDYCIDKGWAYAAYNTGNRGYHVHIPVVAFTEVGAHLRMLNWVKYHFRGFDISLYKSSSVTRIPGTWHSKTGCRMSLESEGAGSSLPDIRRTKLPVPVTAHQDPIESNEDKGIIFMLMLDKHINQGGRRNYAFKLIACGLDAGVKPEDLQRLVEDWSATRSHPSISRAEIQRIIHSAQKRRA